MREEPIDMNPINQTVTLVESVDDPIRLAWEDVVVNGRPPRTTVRVEVLNSWLRCRQMGLDPFQKGAVPLLGQRELTRLLEENEDLVNTAGPIVDMVAIWVRATGFVITLAEKNCYVLKVGGDPDILKMAEENNYQPGCCRTERHAGTNGIGLCLAEGKPVQVTGAEHYKLHYHPWTCSSAPIRDDQGNLLGAVTLSGRSKGRHKHTLALVMTAAETIESQLREKNLINEKQKLNSLLSSIFDSISDGVIAVNHDLSVANINSTAARLLDLEVKKVVGQDLDASVKPDAAMSRAIRSRDYFTHRETRFMSPNGYKTFIASMAPVHDSQGYDHGVIITINEKQKVLNMVKKIGGNYAKYDFQYLKGRNERLLKQIELAKIAAASSSRVLLMGEGGTGKEIFAQAIHNFSDRKNEPFVAISCAAIPRDLIEAELFGYREGAFTGARREGQVGKFELADKGTLFLDEINGLPLDLQAKLLRALQQSEITRLGDTQPISIDVRVIAASNTDLLKEVARSNFREDLFYRLNVVEIVIPPLRERIEDLELLIDHIMGRHCQKMGMPKPSVSDEAIDILRRYSWPGNIRELENCIERAILLSRGETIQRIHLPDRISQQSKISPGEVIPLDQGMQEMIVAALIQSGGNVSEAARSLKISRTTIYRKLKEHNLKAQS